MADIFEERKIFLANPTYCGLCRLPATRRDHMYETYKAAQRESMAAHYAEVRDKKRTQKPEHYGATFYNPESFILTYEAQQRLLDKASMKTHRRRRRSMELSLDQRSRNKQAWKEFSSPVATIDGLSQVHLPFNFPPTGSRGGLLTHAFESQQIWRSLQTHLAQPTTARLQLWRKWYRWSAHDLLDDIYRAYESASHHGISGAYETIAVTLLLSYMFQCIMVTPEEWQEDADAILADITQDAGSLESVSATALQRYGMALDGKTLALAWCQLDLAQEERPSPAAPPRVLSQMLITELLRPPELKAPLRGKGKRLRGWG